LRNATRLHTVFRPDDQADYPGYTAFSLSTAAYESLRASGTTPFTVTALPGSAAGFALPGDRKCKGALTLATPRPGNFALIVNGRRVSVPALHLRAEL